MKYLQFILLFISISLNAQHCPLDNKGLLVVKVETEKGNHQIDILQPILTYRNQNNEDKRVEFIQNKQYTNEFLWNKYHHVLNLNFDFAKNYFIAEIPMDKLKDITIHLQNAKGEKIGAKYQVKETDIFDLHKNFGHNWPEFKERFSPQPLHEFKSLIVLKTNTIEIVKGILFKEKGNNLYYKKQKRGIFFKDQKELDSLVETSQKIDFSKKLVFYQSYYGDCNFKVDIYKIINKKENTITIKSFNKYGGCRAMGRKEMIHYIDKLTKNTKLFFEDVDYEDYTYLNRNYWGF